MKAHNHGQISTEYLIILGFIMFVIVGIIGFALVYTSEVQDTLKMNQLNNFANKIIQSAESVYYAGQPSKVTITTYLPAGVKSIEINGKEIIFNVSTRSGVTQVSYTSKVNINFNNPLSTTEGLKRIQITAQSDNVLLSPS